MFALGAKTLQNELSDRYMTIAAGLTNTCHESYDRSYTKLGPEAFHFIEGNEAKSLKNGEKYYILRPEVRRLRFFFFVVWVKEKGYRTNIIERINGNKDKNVWKTLRNRRGILAFEKLRETSKGSLDPSLHFCSKYNRNEQFRSKYLFCSSILRARMRIVNEGGEKRKERCISRFKPSIPLEAMGRAKKREAERNVSAFISGCFLDR